MLQRKTTSTVIVSISGAPVEERRGNWWRSSGATGVMVAARYEQTGMTGECSRRAYRRKC
jgi:hypothetical protein